MNGTRPSGMDAAPGVPGAHGEATRPDLDDESVAGEDPSGSAFREAFAGGAGDLPDIDDLYEDFEHMDVR